MRRSTFKILFYIKRSNPKKNGKVAIMGRITIDGKRSQFSTKLEIYPDEWNNEWGKSIGNNIEAIAINSMLDKIRGKIVMSYYKLMDIDGYASPDKIKNILLGFEEKGKTIIYYFNKFNEQYRSKVGVTVTKTTYLRYELVKKRLSEFMEKTYKVKDMPYREITTVFIQNFYQFLRSKYKSGNNNAMKTVQHLRAIFFYIKNSGEYFPDPFANFKISFEKKERSFLTKTELIALYNKKLPSERLERVRDIFLFCSYTGLSYSDLQNLTKEKIRTNIDGHLWIMATRNKTGIPYKVRLLAIPIAILKKYEYLQAYGELLPIISNQKMNEYLSEITNICGINKRITSHTARHIETYYHLLINRLCSIRFSIGNDLETSLVLRYA